MNSPWRTNRELRAEIRALKLGLSAADKKANRLTKRIRILDERCVKHHAQERHDQTYIHHLEAQLSAPQVAASREEMRA